MKVLGYVNRFNRGVNMVQEILKENKNGDAIFDFKDISSFKVKVMSADPKPENDTESGIDDTENGIGRDTERSRNKADEAENEAENSKSGAEKTIDVGEMSEMCRRKMSEKY